MCVCVCVFASVTDTYYITTNTLAQTEWRQCREHDLTKVITKTHTHTHTQTSVTYKLVMKYLWQNIKGSSPRATKLLGFENSVCVCVCVCVCVRACVRARERACVRASDRERERERD